jgi:hypothetical protein
VSGAAETLKGLRRGDAPAGHRRQPRAGHRARGAERLCRIPPAPGGRSACAFGGST